MLLAGSGCPDGRLLRARRAWRYLIAVDLRINERIRAPQVRLVGPDGSQIGVLKLTDARRIATELDLDLVEVAPTARPPVCRLMDYGKFKYEQAQKDRETKRRSSAHVLKEMKMRPKIDPHDYGTKKGHIIRFLDGGHKVKVTIMFRGREMAHTNRGADVLNRLAKDLAEIAKVEQFPALDGRNMTMVVAPLKKKAEAKEPETVDLTGLAELADLTELKEAPDLTEAKDGVDDDAQAQDA